MPPQQNNHVDAITLSLQLLAVNHSVYFLFPRADHLPVCLSVAQRAISGHKSIILSAAAASK